MKAMHVLWNVEKDELYHFSIRWTRQQCWNAVLEHWHRMHRTYTRLAAAGPLEDYLARLFLEYRRFPAGKIAEKQRAFIKRQGYRVVLTDVELSHPRVFAEQRAEMVRKARTRRQISPSPGN